jgi:hypothetical protein
MLNCTPNVKETLQKILVQMLQMLIQIPVLTQVNQFTKIVHG